MSEPVNNAYAAIDRAFAEEPASTRRKFVAGAAGALGGLGLLGLPASALAKNDPQTILDVAATAEVLATIVNTVGAEKLHRELATDATYRNVLDAAFQELDHFEVLKSVGARPATKKIWVPDAVFSSRKNLLETLVAGDGIFVNAYQIGITAFGNAGKGKFARYAAEIMGVESVHRALALQSLGKPGNDLAFAGPYTFTKIDGAVKALEHAGFGFGKKGHKPGTFYEFDQVKRRTKHRSEVHALKPH
jgi:hypothetical protein